MSRFGCFVPFLLVRNDAGIVWRRWSVTVGLGLAAVCVVWTTATPAEAAPRTTTVAAGAVFRLAGSPAVLAVPADGRLDGYGFAGSVLGSATAQEVDGQPAGTGRQWWVFAMRWQVTALSPAAAVSAAIVADGQAIALPLPAGAATSPDTGPCPSRPPPPT